ncbi:hypothetical protein WCE55_00825 [Luteimonas sp. MJ293]|uniref:hypothetical protein n=1 Tax=Luteimonas sp. MJ146 TaxID=3129240 RepID=UPI0031BB0AB2
MSAQPDPDAVCWVCSAPIRRKRNGRPRKYCSAACRQKAARSRHYLEAMAEAEKLKLILASEADIDWSDESHRVT